MEKKLRQVTDNIHGTIFLSSLESDLISTPYFYRLHDIYQSSTVYMTFPSNRTKRYEHSLGTMELASSMLFSAVSNANQETRNALFKKLRSYFEAIFDLAICQSENQVAPYFTKCAYRLNSATAPIPGNVQIIGHKMLYTGVIQTTGGQPVCQQRSGLHLQTFRNGSRPRNSAGRIYSGSGFRTGLCAPLAARKSIIPSIAGTCASARSVASRLL